MINRTFKYTRRVNSILGWVYGRNQLIEDDMVNRHKIQSKSFFKFMDVQCEYINLILLNYNNIHNLFYSIRILWLLRKTTDVNIKVRFRYSLFWIKPKHCKWHSIVVSQHLVFHWNQSHFQPFDPIWRCSNMLRYIHVDTRGKHHNGGQPMSKDKCLSVLFKADPGTGKLLLSHRKF